MTTLPAQQPLTSPPSTAPAGGVTPLTAPDPLHHPDPVAVADAAAIENLLRCWVRETGTEVPATGRCLELPLEDGLLLRAPVRYRSPAGWHRFGPAELVCRADEAASAAPAQSGTSGTSAPSAMPAAPSVSGVVSARPADAVTVAALLARTAGSANQGGGAVVTAEGEAAGVGSEHVADLAGRVADSVRRTAQFVAVRRATAEPGPSLTPFLRSEQALLLGHPLHPTPKSREGLGDAEAAAYSPELRGALHLHWFAVDRALVAAGEGTLPSWASSGRRDDGAPDGPSADLLGVAGTARITAALRGADASAPPEGTVLLPVHPWQARELSNRPDVRALLDAGRLRDLGQAGGLWYPTSSVRTVYQPGTPWMLKLSLGLRITNSRRENLRKELLRGAEVHRLLEAGLGAEWRGAHPEFDIVRDPAWIGVDMPGAAEGEAESAVANGFDTVLRQNPFGAEERAHCLAGLVAERPWAGGYASHLAELIHRLSARSGRPVPTVAAEWFLRHLDAVVLPILWLDGHAGIALEAHQQNSLVVLDADGWPVGGRYRDNQGYYFRDSAAAALERRLPGIGRTSDTFVPDAVADERFAYYLGINHLLGLVGAFGAQDLVDERVLLAALRGFLARQGAATGSPLSARLLETPLLRCKANLLTRLHGMDELVGPVETQSVYVPYANPLVLSAPASVVPSVPAQPGLAFSAGPASSSMSAAEPGTGALAGADA
ncbi:IucA/IucC family protein [Streptacidiphilus anmyonensis]|uniref:IucA/IucC family protein n=1 Tax=Streptacidiphilus anmyonensis TaxID=405782 RepID=UPI0007C80155|nr:IucA/IucC family protein [Streptacidiphilus anmyonensis]